MEVRYSTTKKEIIRWYLTRWKQKLWMFHLLIVSLIFLANAPDALKGNVALGAYLAKGAMWSVCAIAFMIIYPILRHKTEERVLEISETGIQTTIGNKAANILWEKIESVEEKDGSVFIIGKNQNGFVVPSRAFADTVQRNEFFEYIKQSIKR